MDVSRTRRLLLPAVVYALILALSSVPGSSIDQFGLPSTFSYLGHAIEYGLLGGALTWALTWAVTDASATRDTDADERDVTRILIVVAVVVAMLGGVDELYQGTVPGRETSMLDLGVDIIAASIASVVVSRRMAGR
jgi:VanZ family protein